MDGYEVAYFIELKRSVEELIDEIRKKISKIEKTIDGYASQMEHVQKVSECAEETLLNILVAIRQNEYLQAWYPKQKGYDEMKVTGKHPGTYI